jgi:hypothetical protein
MNGSTVEETIKATTKKEKNDNISIIAIRGYFKRKYNRDLKLADSYLLDMYKKNEDDFFK